ncbi:MAG: hypothetical protein KUF72_17965, partial [Candidatus Thiodiazotropha sp. (ex Ctena orbiculata)]|nr:hypothetical protein [Candidatus Thiodiazotropha taylori]
YNSMYMSSWFFFVPYRTIWSQWEKYCVDMTLEGKSTVKIPQVSPSAFLFQNTAQAEGVSSLPLRAYNHIWNKWFRDFDYSTEVPLTDATKKYVAHHKDTFTTIRKHAATDSQVTIEPVVLGTGDSPDPMNLGTRSFGDDSSFTFDMDQFHTREDLFHERKKGRFFGDDYHNVMRRMGGMVRRSDDDTPELLCQYQRRIANHDVVSTGDETDLGKYKGYHIGTKRDRFPARVFREHGIILGLTAVRFEPVSRYWTPTEDLDPIGYGYVPNDFPYANRWFGQHLTKDLPIFRRQLASGTTQKGSDIMGVVESHQNLRRCHDMCDNSIGDIWKAWLPTLPDIGDSDTDLSKWIYANQTTYISTIDQEVFKGNPGYHFILKNHSRMSKLSQIPPFAREVNRKH